MFKKFLLKCSNISPQIDQKVFQKTFKICHKIFNINVQNFQLKMSKKFFSACLKVGLKNVQNPH